MLAAWNNVLQVSQHLTTITDTQCERVITFKERLKRITNLRMEQHGFGPTTTGTEHVTEREAAARNGPFKLLQITPTTPLRDIMITIISDHFDDILHNRLPLIERKTGYSMDAIKSAMEQMRTLNPFPGAEFDNPDVQSVTPDLRVVKDENGNYVIELIDEYIPELRISRRYIRMLEGNPDEATKEFIKRKVESAKWLIDSISRRDYPSVQGGILLIATTVIIVNLAVDLVYGLINPRIRHNR